MDMHVRGAGDLSNARLQLPGDLVIRLCIAAGYLHIDWRRQTEIQNLISNVGGFKEEHYFRKFFVQTLAESLGIDFTGLVLGCERNQNVAVARSDGSIVAESQVETAVGQSDIVQNGIQFLAWYNASDLPLDVGKDHFGFLDPGSSRRARMQADLTGIDGGKEIASNQKNQPERTKREDHKAEERRSAVFESPVE